jgi:CRP-like cAMP-binding protein
MNFSDLYQSLYDTVLSELTYFNLGAVFMVLAAMFSAMTYYMRTMVSLRIIGIVANLFYIAYGYFYPSYFVLGLYLSILPINFYRLIEMRRLIEQVRRSANSDQSMDWLKPFMTKRTYKRGRVLFRKGDRAHEMFYVVSGKFLVSEIGVMIPSGQVFGELGMLAPDNRRTSSVECVETGIVLTITYDKVQQLYFQNPTFGFYLLRITTERLLQNRARLEARVATQELAAGPPLGPEREGAIVSTKPVQRSS